MQTGQLRAVEALLRYCHELCVNATGEAASDAALKQRLDALAKLIKIELTACRVQITGAGKRRAS